MRWLIVFPLLAMLVGGCQSYKAESLDAHAALRAWRERSLTSVASFADEQPRRSPTTRPAFDLDDGLSLAEAEAVALLFNPSLRKARLEANAAQVSADGAGRWDDPRLELDLERILSGASDPWVLGGVLNLTIPLSGRLSVEKTLAAAESHVAQLTAVQSERTTIADLRRAWVSWSAHTLKAAALQTAIADLSAIESAAAKLRDAGEIDPTDARLFAIDLVRRRAQLLTIQRDQSRAESRLRQLMGVSPEAPIVPVANLSVDPSLPTHAGDPDPQLAIARAQYAVAERALELETRKQFPDLEIGGGLGADEGDSRLLGALTVPLPVLNANRRAISEAKARREVARAEFESRLVALVSDRTHAARNLESARDSIELIERDLVPLVDRQLLEARKLLDAGEFSPLLVREAIDAATEAKLDLIDARLSLAEATIEQLALTENPFVAAPEATP